MDKVFFKIKKTIPFSTLCIGTEIYRYDNNYYTINGTLIPYFTNYMEKTFCMLIEIYDQKYPKGTIISDLNGNIGVVKAFNNKNDVYTIRLCKNKLIKQVSTQMLKNPETYFFINSKGIIHETYLGMDSDADEWRMQTNNFFTDKEKCKKYKEKILQRNNTDI